MRSWYEILLMLWILLGLPGLVLGYGFAGGDFELPEWRYADPADILVWLVAWGFILSPIWLAPFGIRRPPRSGPETPPKEGS